MMPLFGVFVVAAFWMLLVTGTVVQHAQFGSTVTLGCNISYLFETTWLKQNPELAPAIVLCASFKEGRAVPGFQLNPRYSVGLMNRSLGLQISAVEERDLGLYYCIAKVNTLLKVGRGTMLQVPSAGSPPGSTQIFFYHWYCVFVVFGLLIMVLAVCITHWKTKGKEKIPSKTSPAGSIHIYKSTSGNTCSNKISPTTGIYVQSN